MPPTPLVDFAERSVFLAGSIDNGTAEDWQCRACAAFEDLDVALLNPRRLDWDTTWTQSIEDRQFREQVEWELNALDKATWILLHITASSKAPITLLELGLYARSGKLVISCEDGYWRRGNIEVVARRFEIPLFDHLDEAISRVRTQLIGAELLS